MLSSLFVQSASHRTHTRWVNALFVTWLSVSSFSVSADSLSNARNIERQTNQNATNAQKKIDANSDQSFQLQAEVEQLQAQVDNLSLYQDHLNKLVASQEAEKTNIDSQLIDIAETRQGVVPLMYHMIDGLQSLVEQGVPVRLQSREKRLDDLKTLMGRADISDAEKYRRILEAYQIELDYGSKLGTYEGEIELADSDTRQVDLLYVGRITLLARSKDAQHAWLWSQAEKQWQEVNSDQKAEINKAYAMAAKQQAPSLLTLPLSVTKVSDSSGTQPSSEAK
ncbi:MULTISPECIES: DUF3450 domain-containing protein [Vibrio]|uniref:DUF3450 domain-containing protein n=1 Tax=Vibrio casei TaxID=673372 RepID=A0A368LP24_9VIBR|nr:MULTISPECIES: DUF3450 domain-containing protein [Vibrio]RCS73659.1 DUF3450 domain-containing protein [Vibrio casei]SJN16474.1 TonB system biopolymer transport component; Chromosome segregation ATPase [Vibrio casei]HBV75473.1 DUF3450 domain-containing protein [Vibrio sp.]